MAWRPCYSLYSNLDFRSCSKEELESWATESGLPSYRGRQLFQWLWRPHIKEFSQMTSLPSGLRGMLESQGEIYCLTLLERQISRDGTVKYAWRLRDGSVIESVFIPERRHNTLCISTQVGCKMGCRFCLTAKMGFKRDLTPSEIALQVYHVVEDMGDRRALRNLVFMGMGEPLDNYVNLIKAITILTDPLGLDFSQRRITVSTSGQVEKILSLGKDLDVGLAISLHATSDKMRDKIMPVNRRYPLKELISALRQYPLSKRRRITIEYLMLDGVNDSQQDADRLASLVRGIPVKINLIPFNPSPGIPFRPSPEERVLLFQRQLINNGLTAIIRKSKGRDISAACGQLHRELSAYGELSGSCRSHCPAPGRIAPGSAADGR